jgi:cobalamin biosynthesis protein CbiG
VYLLYIILIGGHHGRNRMVVDLQLPMQSVPITTKVTSSNPAYGEVYSIQHYKWDKVCR